VRLALQMMKTREQLLEREEVFRCEETIERKERKERKEKRRGNREKREKFCFFSLFCLFLGKGQSDFFFWGAFP
jgi:hypothetical protein